MEQMVWRTCELKVLAFSVLSAPSHSRHPPLFSRWGGAEVWVQIDSGIFPHFFFLTSLNGLQSVCREITYAFY